MIFLSLLISAKNLHDRVSKSKNHTIIVDARSFSEYKSGHIPGAINIDLFQLHWFDTSKRGIKDFNRQTRILLSRIGIQSDSHLVFYENVSGILAARGVWLLLYFSHQKVGILDGGFEKWKTDGYPIEVKSNPLTYYKFKGKVNKNVLATVREIRRSLKDKNMIILDARSKEEYVGSDVRAAKERAYPLSSKHRLGKQYRK